MGKNKGGDLIEDRKIRNPMEQMRRKQKFKEKERKKEMKDFIREERMKTAHIDPLKRHDFSAIEQIKAEQARKALGIPTSDESKHNFSGKTGIMTKFMPSEDSQRETDALYYRAQNLDNLHMLEKDAVMEQTSGPSWQDIQNNYFRQLQGEELVYPQQNYDAGQQQRQPQYKLQPYQMKQGQSSAEEIAGSAIIFKKNTQTVPPVQQQKQPQVEEKKQDKQKKKEQTFDDPLDPTKGNMNFREKKARQELLQPQKPQEQQIEEQRPNQYEGVSADIKKALGLDTIQKQGPSKQELLLQALPQIPYQPQPQVQEEKVVPQKRVLPAALRNKQIKPAATQSSITTAIPTPSLLNQIIPIEQINKPVEVPKPEKKKDEGSNLLQQFGNYFSDSDEEEPPKDSKPAPASTTNYLPGQNLMFASLLSGSTNKLQNESDKSNNMEDELKKFLSEV